MPAGHRLPADPSLLVPPVAASGSGVWRVLESGRPAAEAAHLRPPASWRDALLAPGAWDWLGQLAQAQWCVGGGPAVLRAATPDASCHSLMPALSCVSCPALRSFMPGGPPCSPALHAS